MGKSNTGFTADADGGATGMFKANDEPIGNKIMSAISDHYSSKFPMTGAVGGGLYNQVFGDQNQTQQAPLPVGTGPGIVGISGSDVQAPQVHGSGLIKALMSAFM